MQRRKNIFLINFQLQETPEEYSQTDWRVKGMVSTLAYFDPSATDPTLLF